MTVEEVYKKLSEAKIPISWKTSIYDAYCSGWKTVSLFAPRNWYNKYGECALTSLYRYTGFKNDTIEVVAETYAGMEIVGYKITIYFE